MSVGENKFQGPTPGKLNLIMFFGRHLFIPLCIEDLQPGLSSGGQDATRPTFAMEIGPSASAQQRPMANFSPAAIWSAGPT